jgi:CDGSH-type Zn-finger protein
MQRCPRVQVEAGLGRGLSSTVPSLVSGDVHLRAPDGREIERPDPMVLCRCGRSGNKPFCDGTHLTCDFDGTLVSETNRQLLWLTTTGGIRWL